MIEYGIFVVDDEESIREGVTMALDSTYHIDAFATAEAALEAYEVNSPDLVLLDIGLPGIDGIEALKRMKSLHSNVPVIMITAYEDLDTVISAMKLGAYDYVVKPLHMEGLEVSIRNALQTVRLKKEVEVLQERYLRENAPCFVGESNAIQGVMELIEKVAKSPDTPVLIVGETGTGKELLASAIHYKSPNFRGPFRTVNCAAIPKDLIESELFGYERGAFSGASTAGKKGLIEDAANGTLFLDEVGDLNLEAQAKLLRFLELGEFYKVGGTKKLTIQTRVISATNKDLDMLIANNLFRKDLFFRLGVIKVQVPTLNDRRDDIIPLAKHFLLEFNRKFGKEFGAFSTQAEHALKTHKWAGNIRELKNVIERAVLLGEGSMLGLEELGIGGSSGQRGSGREAEGMAFPPLPEAGLELDSVVESLQRYYIEEALRIAGGNESKAAKLLKMNHHTYRYRRRKLRPE